MYNRKELIRRGQYRNLIKLWESILGLRSEDDNKTDDNIKDQMEYYRNRLNNKYSNIINTFNYNDEYEGYAGLNRWYLNNIKDPDLALFNKIINKIRDYYRAGRYTVYVYFVNRLTGDVKMIFIPGNNEFITTGIPLALTYYLRPDITVRYEHEMSTEYIGEILEDYVPYAIDINYHGRNDDPPKEGAFFPYKCIIKNKALAEILKRYGIQDGISEDHCIIEALKGLISGDDWVSNVYNVIGHKLYLSESKLTKIADIIQCTIGLQKVTMNENNKLNVKRERAVYYPSNKKYNKTIKLAIILNHYIIHEKLSVIVKPYTKCKTSTGLITALYNDNKFILKDNICNLKEMRNEPNISLNNINKEQSIVLEYSELSKNCETIPEAIRDKMDKQLYRKKCEFANSSEYMQAIAIDQITNKLKPATIDIFQWFADTEAMHIKHIDTKYRYEQVPYCIWYVNRYKLENEDKRKIFFTTIPRDKEVIKEFLNSFSKGHIHELCFHNMKYDFKLLMKSGLGEMLNILIKGTTIYSVEFIYNDRYFIFIDSYKIIPIALSKFKSVFGLEKGKIGYTLYELYTDESVKYNEVLIQLDPIIKEDDIIYDVEDDKVFRTITAPNKRLIKMNNIIIPTTYVDLVDDYIVVNNNNYYFKHVDYCFDYLKMDCYTHRAGMNILLKEFKTLLGDCFFERLTISSMGHYYMLGKGAYEDVYSVTGELQNYITTCSRGGRVCTAFNNKVNTFIDFKNQNIRIEDYDANGLYPSTMYLLKDELGGILKGKCKVISKEQINIINNQATPIQKVNKLFKLYDDKKTYGCYTVKITRVGKPRAIPSISTRDKKGIDWNNDLVGKTIYLGYYALLSGVEFQDIDFELIEGIYWDEYKDVLCNEIKTLIDLRADIKKSKKDGSDTKQFLLKLFNNSIYGKLLLKKELKKIFTLKKEAADEFINKNFHKLTTSQYPIIKDVNDNEYLQLSIFNETAHYNRAHVAMLILDYSKYLMNRFIYIAEDIGLIVLYTDCDSAHIITECDSYNDGHNRLMKAYIEKYGTNPFGDGIGQFKSDFKFENHSDIYSIGMIALAKKQYLHKLRGINNDTKELEYKYVIHNKGFSEDSIIYHVNKYYNGDIEKLYTDGYNDVLIKIDPTGEGTLACFDISNKGVYTKDKYLKRFSGTE